MDSGEHHGNALELTRMDRVEAEDDAEEEEAYSESEPEGQSIQKRFHERTYDTARDSWAAAWSWIGLHSNFYRIHMIVFTLVPLIASGIFYGVDTRGNSYVNSLTVCTSAMTVTGLNPVLMENTSHFQQALCFFLSLIGSTTGVSLMTIVIRRHFFRKRFEHMVKTDPRARKRVYDVEVAEGKRRELHPWLHPFHFGEKRMAGEQVPRFAQNSSASPMHSRSGSPHAKTKKRKGSRLRTDMIRRVDAPVMVNRMNIGGLLSDEQEVDDPSNAQAGASHEDIQAPDTAVISPKAPVDFNQLEKTANRSESPTPMLSTIAEPVSPSRKRRISLAELPSGTAEASRQGLITIQEGTRPPVVSSAASSIFVESSSSEDEDQRSVPGMASRRAIRQGALRSRRMSDPTNLPSRPKDPDLQKEFKRIRTMDPPKHLSSFPSPSKAALPRTQTIEIREPPQPSRSRGFSSAVPHVGGVQSELNRRRTATNSSFGAPLQRARRSSLEPMPRTLTRGTAMASGFGGFPNPVKVVASAAQKRLLPRTATLDVPRTTTLQSVRSEGGLSSIGGGHTKAVSYISFDAVVGRNSRFYSLTSAQRDELGGVEYRALSMLLKIVTAYYVLVQLVPMIILAPIFASSHYNWLFRDQDQGSMTGAGAWYVVFNVGSAYSNSGLSLLDESMTPFQQSYGYVLLLSFCILAGNTAFPVFLRLAIWLLSKVVPKSSRHSETLKFLLDHPRRCFIYLFPSHQTWLLVAMLVVLNVTDWICFIVLDLGGSFLEALPPAARAIDGLFQAFAVRAAGFSIVSLSQTAPALQFLYVVMMYIAVYPVAMSIRSTNVYEESSMGIFDDHSEDASSQIEAEYQKSRNVGSYFAHHARKQLAFDIWWLGLALWAICIVERRNIDDDATDSYFNIFTIMFELVSAYGTVGLSLGTPTANYSLCGDFRILSKVILCAVMIRGRHRGLPVAIDRSILLPSDLEALHRAPNDLTPSDTLYKGDRNPDAKSFRTFSTMRARGRTEGSMASPRRTASNDMSKASPVKRNSGTGLAPTRTFSPPGTARQPRPTLNGYLSTIYSQNPSPATTPEPESEAARGPLSREEATATADTSPADSGASSKQS